MLTHLMIRGLAIIEELSIDFSPKLNVITGETGAGKSILIKALNLVLGGKATGDVVRRGWEKALVTAVFDFSDTPSFQNIASSEGIALDEGRLILKRQVSVKGRSQAWLNDVPVTVAKLKQLASHLIDIFGQHDNHRLLEPSQHASYLDRFLKNPKIVSDYRKNYAELLNLQKTILNEQKEFVAKAKDLDYLQFRDEEMSNFGPELEDYKNHEERLDRSKTEFDLKQQLMRAKDLSDNGYRNQSLSHAFRDIEGALIKKNGEIFSEKLEQLCQQAAELTDEISFELDKQLDHLDIDEVSLLESEKRLSKYHDLFKKLGVRTIEELVEARDQIRADIDFVEDAELRQQENLNALRRKVEKLEAIGAELKKQRKKAFKLVSGAIRGELEQLNMPGAELFLDSQAYYRYDQELAKGFEQMSEVDVSILDRLANLGPDGLESLQFLLRSNTGEEAKALSRIASGGEISRIMLGIKKVLSADAQTCVMVFDEIDTGISGETASIVGRKLFEIAEKFQVICVSHLPQVAVFGSNHLKVAKLVSKGRTESKIESLSKQDSEKEIARLLSGGKITKSSLENARSLRSESLRKPRSRMSKEKRA